MTDGSISNFFPMAMWTNHMQAHKFSSDVNSQNLGASKYKINQKFHLLAGKLQTLTEKFNKILMNI